MKIAAAERSNTRQPCRLGVPDRGGNNVQTPHGIIAIPTRCRAGHEHLEPAVVGLDPLQAQYSQQYGPGNYAPNVRQYWSMRVMAYLQVLVLLMGLWGLWLIRRKRLETSRVFLWVAVWAAVLPFLMNTAGWLLTENGRQPWIVQGIMLTKDGISPNVSTAWLWISLVAFILLYGVLGTVDLVLMLRYSRKQLPPQRTEAEIDTPIPAVQY
jgi:cytochrome d ubiquinol oxidase subunit I